MCVLSSFSIPTAGSAQSVLERVLGQVESSTNLAPVNGVFANVAESVSDFQPAQAVTEPYTLATIDASFDPPGNDNIAGLYRLFRVVDSETGLAHVVTGVEYNNIGTTITGGGRVAKLVEI